MSIQSPSSAALTLLLFFFVRPAFIPVFVGPVSIRLFVCTADFRFSTFARTDCMPARSKIRDCINHRTNRHDAATRPIFYVITRFHKTVIGKPDGHGLLMINVLLTADSLSASVLSLIIHY